MKPCPLPRGSAAYETSLQPNHHHGLALMLLLLLLITATGIRNMAAINDRMDKIVSGLNVKINQITNLRTIARERSLLIYHILFDRDPFVVDEEIQQLSLLAGQFMQIRDQFFYRLALSQAGRRC